MAEQFQSAAEVGIKTFQKTGASLGDTSLKAILQTDGGLTDADLDEIKHVDIQVVSGTVYTTSDNSTASVTKFQRETGTVWQIKNSRHLIVSQVRLFAAAAYDIRINAAK